MARLPIFHISQKKPQIRADIAGRTIHRQSPFSMPTNTDFSPAVTCKEVIIRRGETQSMGNNRLGKTPMSVKLRAETIKVTAAICLGLPVR